MSTHLSSQIHHLDSRIREEFEHLLKTAPPRPLKSHQIAKTLKAEAPDRSKRDLESQIIGFYRLPYEHRSERAFYRMFAIKPYPWLMQQFVLNFSNAAVSETTAASSASRIRHHMKNLIQIPEAISSTPFIHAVVSRITNPRHDQINTGIALKHFVEAWHKLVFLRFGSKHEAFFKEFEVAIDYPEITGSIVMPGFVHETNDPTTIHLELTQTDLEWMKEILICLENGSKLPLYPLSRGPQNSLVTKLETLVRAAHESFPLRYSKLEETLQRVCFECLTAYRQTPKTQGAENVQQCDTHRPGS